MNKSELIAAMRNHLDSKSENGKYDNDWGASQEEGFEEAIKAVKSFIPTSLRLDGDKEFEKWFKSVEGGYELTGMSESQKHDVFHDVWKAAKSLNETKELNFADYCIKCYGRQIDPSEILPVGYPFAQANYTQYLAALSLSSDEKGVEIERFTYQKQYDCPACNFNDIRIGACYCVACGSKTTWK